MIKENIEKDYLQAYKARDGFKVSVLRMLRTAIKNYEIAEKKTVSDDEVISLVKREIKQRKDTAETYKKAGIEEAVQKELNEIELLTQYLPKQLSENEIQQIVSEAISSTGATSLSQTGQVIGVIMKKYGSRVDGSAVSKMVREKLN